MSRCCWPYSAVEEICAISGRELFRPRGYMKLLDQRRAAGEHSLDCRSSRVQVVAQGVQFALLGLDLGQAGKIAFRYLPKPRPPIPTSAPSTS
jgi:hypothetical protein